MTDSNQTQLDELIAESKTMYDDAAMQAFAAKWRAFLHSLNKTDGRIACYAYFDAIFETLDQIKEDVKDLVENGTEQERLDYFNLLEELKAPLISAKLRRAA